MSRLAAVLCICFLVFGGAGCSKGNIFGAAHKPGSSSDIQSLTSDAYTAFREKNYAKALEYYAKILEKDPSNSEAIYGYSAAKLADAGLDVAAIVSNLVTQNNAPGLNSLSDTLNAVSRTSADPDNILPDSILNNLTRIRAAVDAVLASDKLPKILNGLADGSIKADNADLNLNVALCLVLRAAMRLVDDNGDFFLSFDTGYNVEDVASTLTDEQKLLITESSKDIVRAFRCLKTVFDSLRLDTDSSIAGIKDDVSEMLDNLDAALDAALYTDVVVADINTVYPY